MLFYFLLVLGSSLGYGCCSAVSSLLLAHLAVFLSGSLAVFLLPADELIGQLLDFSVSFCFFFFFPKGTLSYISFLLCAHHLL